MLLRIANKANCWGKNGTVTAAPLLEKNLGGNTAQDYGKIHLQFQGIFVKHVTEKATTLVCFPFFGVFLRI